MYFTTEEEYANEHADFKSSPGANVRELIVYPTTIVSEGISMTICKTFKTMKSKLLKARETAILGALSNVKPTEGNDKVEFDLVSGSFSSIDQFAGLEAKSKNGLSLDINAIFQNKQSSLLLELQVLDVTGSIIARWEKH